MADDTPVVFFDGVCNLCNGAVQFILRKETGQVLKFAPLQGATFQRLRAPENEQLPDSILFFEHGRFYAESAAVLRIARYLSLPWRLLSYPGWLVPAFLRDAIYRFIARNRYRWFGKKEACYLPTPELRGRFLA